jgi:DNA-binding HxlR family transcriptional regulator
MAADPLEALLDLLGRRWTLRVIWELRADDGFRFRQLQRRCGGVSASVLNLRLHELRDAGIVEYAMDGYTLSREGRELLDAYESLSAWSSRRAGR